MNHYYLREHTDSCIRQQKEAESITDEYLKSFHTSCNHSKEDILFYHNCDFHIITIFNCFIGYDRYESIQNLLNSLIKKSSVTPIDRAINKSVRYKDIKNILKDFTRLGSSVTEINYIYSDNAGKEFCITTKSSFIDKLIDIDLLKDNYEKSKVYINNNIKECNRKYYLDTLKTLYNHNKFYMDYECSEVKILNSIDGIIKEINKQTR